MFSPTKCLAVLLAGLLLTAATGTPDTPQIARSAPPIVAHGAAYTVSEVAADPELNVPALTPLGKFVVLTAEIPDPAPGSRITVRKSFAVAAPDGATYELRDCDGGHEYWLTGTAGTYTATLEYRLFETIATLQVDPADPADQTKWKVIERTIPCFDANGDVVHRVIAKEFVIGEPAPPPPPPPPESGERTIFIVHETEDDTPAQAMTLVALRAGPQATWLRSQGHKLYVLDDDEGDGRGNRAPLLVRLDPYIKDVPLPALVVCDTATGKVLAKQTIPAGTSADAIVEAIKEAGG